MKLNSSLTFLLLIFSCSAVLAQEPDDAIKYSWFVPGGTARNIAIGGAMASLGGDISSNNINPAGIALYRTNEFVLTPGFQQHNNKSGFLGTNTMQKKNAFAYGSIGLVLATPQHADNTRSSTTFSISVTQLASYNNQTHYTGFNNYSSYSEKYLEELIGDGASPSAAENNYIFGSSLAYRTYLIDSVNVDGQLTGYRSLVPIDTGVQQDRLETTSGGMHEVSFSFGSNTQNQLMLGASLNIPIISYTRELQYSERDISGNLHNDFDYFTYNEHYTSNGAGVNLKLGLIYIPQPKIRLGLAFHTPSLMQVTDKIRSSMTTNTEDYAGLLSESSDNLNSGNAGETTYRFNTPLRVIASGSFVFNPVQDPKKQNGFVTADIEYVNYRGSRYNVTPDNQDDVVGKQYFSTLNDIIKEYYKGNINVKVGGELKFNPWAFRLGAAYYGSPYSDKSLKANKVVASGGIGYRNHGIFIDLTLAEALNKDVSFPYRLNDKANVFATTKDSRTSIVATIGFKF